MCGSVCGSVYCESVIVYDCVGVSICECDSDSMCAIVCQYM